MFDIYFPLGHKLEERMGPLILINLTLQCDLKYNANKSANFKTIFRTSFFYGLCRMNFMLL